MTGLLYIIVIGMWLVVLGPILLKSNERKKIEQAMLSELGEHLKSTWRFAQRAPLTAKQKQFVRRRRVTMLLLTSVVFAIVGASTGRFSMFWVAVPATLLGGFIFVAAKHSMSAVKRATPVRTVDAQPAAPEMQTSLETMVDQITEAVVNDRKWTPVEPVLPSYVNATAATPYRRNIENSRPWTGQEMVEQAEALRQARTARLQEAHARIEKARAIALERSRAAAMGKPQVARTEEPPAARAAGE